MPQVFRFGFERLKFRPPRKKPVTKSRAKCGNTEVKSDEDVLHDLAEQESWLPARRREDHLAVAGNQLRASSIR
jgi:hypothetical protein